MGRVNEEVFTCGKCRQSVAFEPTGDGTMQDVGCHHCGAKHRVRVIHEVRVFYGGERLEYEK